MNNYSIGSDYPEINRLDCREEDSGVRYTSPVCICDFCGEGIFAGEAALKVLSTRDVIHASCWEDYSQDNQSCLTREYDTTGGME